MNIKSIMQSTKTGNLCPYDKMIETLNKDQVTTEWKRKYYKIITISTYALRGAVNEERAKKDILESIQ